MRLGGLFCLAGGMPGVCRGCRPPRRLESAGVQGAEHAISVGQALERCTAGTARVNGDADRLGTIEPGKLADLVACPADPTAVPVDDLPDLTPVFTIVGGRAVHDPQGTLRS